MFTGTKKEELRMKKMRKETRSSQMKVLQSFESPRTGHPMTQHPHPRNPDLQSKNCENLLSSVVIFIFWLYDSFKLVLDKKKKTEQHNTHGSTNC